MHPGLSEPRTKEQWRAYISARSPGRPELPARADYDAMTDEERRPLNRARKAHHSALILVEAPQVKRLHRQMGKKLTLNEYAPAGARLGVVIDGPPTVGKSTLVKWFGANFENELRELYPERFDQKGADYTPVVYVSVNAGATPKMLSASLAEYMNLRIRSGANISEITNRVLDAFEKCGVRLVIIDDVHFLDLSYKEGRLVNDHLKYLANYSAATFIYAGVDVEESGLFLEGKMRSTRSDSEQYRVRATQTSDRFTCLELKPFSTDGINNARELALVVETMESALVLFDHEPKSLRKHLRHLQRRTGGSIRHLSALIREAANDAIDTGTESITLELMDDIILSKHIEDQNRLEVARERALQRKGNSTRAARLAGKSGKTGKGKNRAEKSSAVSA